MMTKRKHGSSAKSARRRVYGLNYAQKGYIFQPGTVHRALVGSFEKGWRAKDGLAMGGVEMEKALGAMGERAWRKGAIKKYGSIKKAKAALRRRFARVGKRKVVVKRKVGKRKVGKRKVSHRWTTNYRAAPKTVGLP